MDRHDRMLRLDGKAALVTGGGSGIGLATASRLRAEGARVAICGRDSARLSGAAERIGDGVMTVPADVAKLADIDRLFAVVAGQLGNLDVLFINAGVGSLARLAETTEALYDEVFAINTKGAFFTMQKSLSHLNDGASIIFNSIAPVQPAWRRPGTSVYAASKAALNSIVQTAAVELADRHIRVNVISPGPIRTPIYEHMGVPPEVIEARQAKMAAELVPLKRLGTPEEVAGVVAFLASDDASYITGGRIDIDGGMG
jgi:NAD(P)-dependent dehydrogenase (short-subunit alcohol dehydrogenase family)